MIKTEHHFNMPPKIPKKTIPKEQAKVLFSYTAENDDELTIKEGDIINIIEKEIEDKGWMKGELNNKIGVFPDNFVQIIIKPSPPNLAVTNSVFKNSNLNNFNNNLNNGNSIITADDSPPKLPIKKPVPENKLSKVIPSKFTEIISKSNSSLNESTQKSSLFLSKQQQNNSDDLLTNNTSSNLTSKLNNSSSSTSVPPTLPLKKSKLFSTPKPFQKEELIAVDQSLTNDKTDANELSSFIDEQQHNNSIKLTHLTASRVRPTNRRPPSIIQISKDDELNLTSSNSLNNLSDLMNNDKKENHSSDSLIDDSISHSSFNQSNKELSKQSSKNNLISDMSSSKTTASTPLTNQQPPAWMVELKKTQAEKKNEVKMKKNFNLSDENNANNLNQSGSQSLNQSLNQSITSTSTSTSTFNGTSPSSSKKSIITTSNHRMSGDYSQSFKSFLQTQNSPNTNSLSRHSSVNNSINHNFNSSRTLSTDSLDCKEQPTSTLGFGQLITSPFSSVKPVKAAKPTTAKFSSSSPTTGQNSLSSNLNNNQSTSIASTSSINHHSKDTVSRKEFEDLQKKVNDLSEALETQKQTYKGLIKDLIDDIAEEKKKVANLTIEVDRLRKNLIF